MAIGYSDFFIITREQLLPIAILCGVFSAMNMFVEIAIPTAIVLTTKREDVVFLADTEYKAEIYWENHRTEFEERYHTNVGYLYKNWDTEILFIHPVKLSKWSLWD